ncbi:hypothetical protein XELAEV_18022073mg [Xenopus laevis]|uniref:CTCK domain-containing protein n=1 Tax=Xenopus laevis TaxID=8355 RepID=A0A974D1N2_XENLA|nr:hypothetical protein XELAEV_18022073mg [Xenopus laevis]
MGIDSSRQNRGVGIYQRIGIRGITDEGEARAERVRQSSYINSAGVTNQNFWLRGQEYIHSSGQCCGQCVQTSCVVTTSNGQTHILKEGETWSPSDDRCTTYNCTLSQGQLSTVVTKKSCAVVSVQDCKSGEQFQMSSDQCCGKCVRTACIITTAGGETKVLTEGEIWSPSSDICTSYNCTLLQDQLSTVVAKKSCAIFSANDCSSGQEYKITSGQCCGECIETTCVFQTASGDVKSLKKDESWISSDDLCTNYSCILSEGKLATVVTKTSCLVHNQNDCGDGEEYQDLTGNCCGKCVQNSCVAITSSGEIQTLQEGQSWTSSKDPCTFYNCKKIQGNFITETVKKSCVYLSELDCAFGQKYINTSGECCGHCVGTSCAITTITGEYKLIDNGTSWTPSYDACTTYICVMSQGQLSTIVEKQTCSDISASNCTDGEEYKYSIGQCCGKCVKTSCAVTVDGETKLLKEGESWSPSGNNCSNYLCTKINGQLSTTVLKKACEYLSKDDCAPNEQYQISNGSCCGECIQTTCKVTTDSGEIIFMEEGETWTPSGDNCTTYNCTRIQGRLSYLVTMKACLVQSSTDCDNGKEYQIAIGQCCGQCVQTSCLVTYGIGGTKLLKAGESWSPNDDFCNIYNCTLSQGQLVTTITKETCTAQSSNDCALGQEYQFPNLECCGTCVQTSCIFTTSTGVTQVLKEGETWSSSDDACTIYNCTRSQGQLSTAISIKSCNVLSESDCRANEIYLISSGQCCGQCIQTSCVLTTVSGQVELLKEGESWSEINDNCTSYVCNVAQGQFSTVVHKKACVNITAGDCDSGSVEMSDDGCCLICKAPKLCRRVVNNTLLTNGTCSLVAEVPYCDGYCQNLSECQCCQQQVVSLRTVQLNCADTSTLNYNYPYVESCGCGTVPCEVLPGQT